MGRRKSLNKAPNREKNWEKTFSALVELSGNLHRDRQVLEERIKVLKGIIYEMKVAQKYDSAKAGVILGLKDREAFIYKNRYEDTDNELADFREWFEYLSQKCSKPSITSTDVSNVEVLRTATLENEVRKLKSEIEQLKLEKNTEVSALLSEKNIIWNQYRRVESDFKSQLDMRCNEIERANEKVQLLMGRGEQFQASNENLRTELSEMESKTEEKSEEISQLLKVIEHLKATSGSALPLLHSCRTGAAASCRKGKNSSTSTRGRVSAIDKESEKRAHTKSGARKSTGGKAPKKIFISKGSSSSSKGKLIDAIGIADTPRLLFSSEFKVPKLKSSSSTPVE